MRNKTKIVVLHQKEVIYTAIFVLLGILFIILMLVMFLPGRSDSPTDTSQAIYHPGVYTTCVRLGENTVDIEVYVDADNINSIRMVNLDETISTLYPLMEPAFAELSTQIVKTQTLDGVTYDSDSKYTSLLLLDAIETSLNKARIAGE